MEKPMDSKSREILERVERGELTPEQGAALLAGTARQIPVEPVSGGEPPSPGEATNDKTFPHAPHAATPEPEVVEDLQGVYAFWKRWWMLPLWVGGAIFIAGGLIMIAGQNSGQMFWFYCAILPLLLGATVMVLSFWSRNARWLHVRVREAKNGVKKNIAISFPIPTSLIGFGLSAFGNKIPGLREQPQIIEMMPELMKTLDETGEPLIVEVNEKDGDEVRVYIM
jgi:hypothetical protein